MIEIRYGHQVNVPSKVVDLLEHKVLLVFLNHGDLHLENVIPLHNHHGLSFQMNHNTIAKLSSIPSTSHLKKLVAIGGMVDKGRVMILGSIFTATHFGQLSEEKRYLLIIAF